LTPSFFLKHTSRRAMNGSGGAKIASKNLRSRSLERTMLRSRHERYKVAYD